MFDNHVIDDAYLLNKLQVGTTKDRAKIMSQIDKLDEALTLQPNDVFEWRATNRVLFRYLFSLGHHGQVLWLRFNEHEGAGALNQFDDFIDDMDDTYFWPIWLICPTYFHYNIANKMDMHQSYLDEYLVWSYGLATLIAVMDFLLQMIKAFKLSKGSPTALINALSGYAQGYVMRVAAYESVLLLVAHFMKVYIPVFPVIDDFLFFMAIYFVGPAYMILIVNTLIIDLGQTIGVIGSLGHTTAPKNVPKKVPAVVSPVSTNTTTTTTAAASSDVDEDALPSWASPPPREGWASPDNFRDTGHNGDTPRA